jgi:BirA family biotin operon repressor/biotin-[acetyl-CoA-carboxylase] ligase
MTTRAEILRLLANGAFHSGTDMGRRLGISRAAVCKNVRALSEAGVVVHCVTGRGYRLEAPLCLLERRRILKHLHGIRGIAGRLTLREEVTSTNRFLLEEAARGHDISGAVCLSEAQPQGRGRRGRQWVTSPYSNIMLSMGWRFRGGPGLVSGLSLSSGVAVMRALTEYSTSLGGAGLGLKWPNDVLWGERKLAGLLVDVQGEASGPSLVVLGVGINCAVNARAAARIDQPWVDLHTITGEPIDRNRLAALVIRHLHDMFQAYAASGFDGFRREWERLHLFEGRRVRVSQGEHVIDGTVEGVDEIGALQLRDAGGLRHAFHSGEVSLRPVK